MPLKHKNSDEANKHTPKGFDNASNFSRLLRDEIGTSRYTRETTLPPALNFVDGANVPPTTVLNDVYVLIDNGGGAVNANWGGASYNDWVRFNGTNWGKVTPTAGDICYDQTAGFYKVFSTSWAQFIPDAENMSNANLTFGANHYADLSTFSWTLGGTAPIGTEKISFQKDTLVKGSDTSASTKGFEIVDQINASLWNWRNNGDIYQSKASTWFQGGSLTIDAVGNNVSIIDSGNVNSGTFSRVSGQGFIFNRSTTTGALTVQQSGVNKVLLGSNADYWGSSKIYLGSTTGADGLTIETDRIRYYTSVGSAGVIHDIHADRFALFGSGFSTPSNSYVSFGSFTRVGTENISLQGTVLMTTNVRMSGLPTSSVGLSAGDLWNDAGTLKIV